MFIEDNNPIKDVAEINVGSLYIDKSPFFNKPPDPRPYMTVVVNKMQFSPLVDTGAVVCVLAITNESELEPYREKLLPVKVVVNTVHAQRTPALGIMNLKYTFGNRRAVVPTVVIMVKKRQFILGMNFFRAFDIRLTVSPDCYAPKTTFSVFDATNVETIDDGNVNELSQSTEQANNESSSLHLQNHDPNAAMNAENTTKSMQNDTLLPEDDCIYPSTDSAVPAATTGVSRSSKLSSGETSPLMSVQNLLEQLIRLTTAFLTNAGGEFSDLSQTRPDKGLMETLSLGIGVMDVENYEEYEMAVVLAKVLTPLTTGQTKSMVMKPIKYMDPADLMHRTGWATNCRFDADVNESAVELTAIFDLLEMALGPPNDVEIGESKLAQDQAEVTSAASIVNTAAGNEDTVNDVLPEKIESVTLPHELNLEQHQRLKQVQESFPYTPQSGPLNKTQSYIQRINLVPGAVPVRRQQYPLSPYVLEEVRVEIDKLLERDIIEPIDSSPWRWPFLWVRKKTGGGRICLDARGLNTLTIPDAYPSLNVDQILRSLPQAKYITGLDMTQAFHQIEIAKEDRGKTAFAVDNRFYCYKRAVMGFRNSPADLTKMLDNIFHDMTPSVYHYVDDFIILSSTFDEHIRTLEEVARRLKAHNLTISREKSSFCHKRLSFLGYILTEKGLEANPDRIQPILTYKRPETVKDVRRLVGLANWYRRFMPNAAEKLAPLSDLITKDSKQKSSGQRRRNVRLLNSKDV